MKLSFGSMTRALGTWPFSTRSAVYFGLFLLLAGLFLVQAGWWKIKDHASADASLSPTGSGSKSNPAFPRSRLASDRHSESVLSNNADSKTSVQVALSLKRIKEVAEGLKYDSIKGSEWINSLPDGSHQRIKGLRVVGEWLREIGRDEEAEIFLNAR